MKPDQVIPLKLIKSARMPTAAGYNFRLSIWKPSHFFTGLELHTSNTTWRTFRFGKFYFGVRLRKASRREIEVNIYGNRTLPPTVRDALFKRLANGYGFNDDLRRFNQMVSASKFKRPLQPMRGMRISCPESFFEITILSLLLQNTTIRRTTQMFRSLMIDYGSIVRFDGVTLRLFFAPEDLLKVAEGQLRERNRLGYRAKYLPEFARFFSEWDKPLDRGTEGRATLIQELQSIKGIGPYSANVIASSALRDTRAVPLDVWNVRLLSKALFDKDSRDADRVLRRLGRLFPEYEGLAALYFLENAYLHNPMAPLMHDVDGARRASARLLEAS
jgi:3-methyladenine DNA glycosylase/8-oxoguanine DNA glycosylase